MDVATIGRVVELTPWDRLSGAEACTQALGYLAHSATLTLNQVGEWTLLVRGRRVRGDGTVDDTVTAERTVVVVQDADAVGPLEVTLGFGKEVAVDGIFRVGFFQLVEDSRCPTDVVCVWEGNAAVGVGLTLGTGPTYPFTLNTTLEPGAVEHGGWRVTLVDVLPAPVSTQPIPPQAYRARLRIQRIP
jgi:hypothetical protein